MKQTYTFFEKTFFDYLKEYKTIFEEENETLSDFEQLWSNYLEMLVEPFGWQGIWKVTRPTCESLTIMYPTTLLVLVENVNFQELTAQVNILQIENSYDSLICEGSQKIQVYKKFNAPLLELYPTQVQDNTVVLNLTQTAEALDVYRYFYNNIWFPWDLYNTSKQWYKNHLEQRLRLSYDLVNNTIPKEICKEIKSITMAAKNLNIQREELENQVDEDCNAMDIDNAVSLKLTKIQIKLLNLQLEFDVFSNFKNKSLEKPQNSITSLDQTFILFNKERNLEDTLKFLQQISISAEKYEIKYNLQQNLLTVLESNLLLLSPDIHEIEDTFIVDRNFTIRGFKSTISMAFHLAMFELSGENIVIEDLVLDIADAFVGLLIRRGNVTINNCKIIGKKNSTTQRAIVVFPEGKLIMNSCKIEQVSVGIVGKTNSEITLNNCEITNVNIGLRMNEECYLKTSKSSFMFCRLFGICLESANFYSSLAETHFVTLENCKMEKNGKDNCIIEKKEVSPMKDIFSETFIFAENENNSKALFNKGFLRTDSECTTPPTPVVIQPVVGMDTVFNQGFLKTNSDGAPFSADTQQEVFETEL